MSSEKDTNQSNLKDEVLKLFIWTFHQRIIEDYFTNVIDKEESKRESKMSEYECQESSYVFGIAIKALEFFQGSLYL